MRATLVDEPYHRSDSCFPLPLPTPTLPLPTPTPLSLECAWPAPDNDRQSPHTSVTVRRPCCRAADLWRWMNHVAWETPGLEWDGRRSLHGGCRQRDRRVFDPAEPDPWRPLPIAGNSGR